MTKIQKAMSKIHWRQRKKGMSFRQAWKYTKKAKGLSWKFKRRHAYKDYDGDGVVNRYDCEPLNKFYQDYTEEQIQAIKEAPDIIYKEPEIVKKGDLIELNKADASDREEKRLKNAIEEAKERGDRYAVGQAELQIQRIKNPDKYKYDDWHTNRTDKDEDRIFELMNTSQKEKIQAMDDKDLRTASPKYDKNEWKDKINKEIGLANLTSFKTGRPVINRTKNANKVLKELRSKYPIKEKNKIDKDFYKKVYELNLNKEPEDSYQFKLLKKKKERPRQIAVYNKYKAWLEQGADDIGEMEDIKTALKRPETFHKRDHWKDKLPRGFGLKSQISHKIRNLNKEFDKDVFKINEGNNFDFKEGRGKVFQKKTKDKSKSVNWDIFRKGIQGKRKLK